MNETILVLNAGSSTQKYALYQFPNASLPAQPPSPLWQAQLEGTSLRVSTAKGVHLESKVAAAAPELAIPEVLATLYEGASSVLQGADDVKIVGHRVVHGGQAYTGPTLVTPEVKATIAKLASLAPAHNPAALAGIEAVERTFGAVTQLAVFDTAFHHSIPEAAAAYPVPYAWTERGLRRYGFHGISHAYSAERAAVLLGRDLSSLRLITCHLGNGCSLAAVRGGTSIDTTMGFTPLEGLMMGTRSGSVDPGMLLYLMRQEGYSADDLTAALNAASGLKGVSGISGDVRDVIAAAQSQPRARLALDIYIHRVRYYLGAMLASLGGLDALVFTAGVGEHSALVRARVCEAFTFLGLELDANKNAASTPDSDIASDGSSVRVLVVRAEENWAIAQACWTFLRSRRSDCQGK